MLEDKFEQEFKQVDSFPDSWIKGKAFYKVQIRVSSKDMNKEKDFVKLVNVVRNTLSRRAKTKFFTLFISLVSTLKESSYTLNHGGINIRSRRNFFFTQPLLLYV